MMISLRINAFVNSLSYARKSSNFILKHIEKRMVPCKSTAKEVSFEWSHHRISSTDSKVRTTLHVSIIDCRSERVKWEKWNENELQGRVNDWFK